MTTMSDADALGIDFAALGNARLIDLAQPMKNGMPQSPNHPPFRMILERRHGDMVRSDGGSASNEVIITGGHVGTHVDALGHVSQDGLIYGGIKAESIQSHLGLSEHGIDTFTPYVGRGVLLDITKVKGVDTLDPGYGITADDLEAAEDLAGVKVQEGDAVLIGSGWSRLWDDRLAFQGVDSGVPGPDVSAGKWLQSKKVRVAGAETIAFEQLKPGAGHATLPVHRVLLVDAGINIIETMRLHELLDSGASEFLFVLAPIRVVGATGAPVRPLALIPGA
jgi:kynurenine formamidase